MASRPATALIGYLPRYAPYASRLRWLLHLRERLPGAAALGERLLGISAARALPRWHASALARRRSPTGAGAAAGRRGRDVVAAGRHLHHLVRAGESRARREAVLSAAGYRVHLPAAPGGRPLCCGRTFLAVGLVEEARHEARAHARGAAAAGRAGPAGDRPRAVLPA